MSQMPWCYEAFLSRCKFSFLPQIEIYEKSRLLLLDILMVQSGKVAVCIFVMLCEIDMISSKSLKVSLLNLY